MSSGKNNCGWGGKCLWWAMCLLTIDSLQKIEYLLSGNITRNWARPRLGLWHSWAAAAKQALPKWGWLLCYCGRSLRGSNFSSDHEFSLCTIRNSVQIHCNIWFSISLTVWILRYTITCHREIRLGRMLIKSSFIGHGNPLQYSCLENPMDIGVWQATVHKIAKSRTRLKWLSMHARMLLLARQKLDFLFHLWK